MALKPTIFKARIAVSDLDRDFYDTLNLTIAQHPSETTERMMARVLAFCINAREGLGFTKGLSEPDVPDIECRSLDGRLLLWIDVGEPAPERIKKATRVAEAVRVYSFNTKSDAWWQQAGAQISDSKAEVFQLRWVGLQALTALVQRTMEMSVTLSGDSAYFSSDAGDFEISWTALTKIS